MPRVPRAPRAPTTTPPRPLLFAAAVLLVLLCAVAASLLIDWHPNAKGLPEDIAAIEKPDRRPAVQAPAMPRTIKPSELPLD